MEPKLIQTTKGELAESLLEKKDGVDENDNEVVRWVEYWLDGELVHRSVAVQLKKWPEGLGAIAAEFNR